MSEPTPPAPGAADADAASAAAPPAAPAAAAAPVAPAASSAAVAAAETRAETSADDERIADLADDFLRRHRAGLHPTVEEYAQKHPELAGQIRGLFPPILMMEQTGTAHTADVARVT